MLDLIEDSPKIRRIPDLVPPEIGHFDRELLAHFAGVMCVDPSLTRPLVSFQANKDKRSYRWFKYKEGFSSPLIEGLMGRFKITSGRILDPFAGGGTALFVASDHGLDADGIELLPIGQEIIETRRVIESDFGTSDAATVRRWITEKPWNTSDEYVAVGALRITAGAYPPETLASIERYLGALSTEEACVGQVLRFALLCVLESVSFTRKDGQYLRWDHRSGRRQGAKAFDKGAIQPFDKAISAKLTEILLDAQSGASSDSLFATERVRGSVSCFGGSCLDLLPTFPANGYDGIITSPPYCNRYDYTRTYALELALMGTSEAGLSGLRQEMLSCTVENRAKDLLSMNPDWRKALTVVENHWLLQSILSYLEAQKASGKLNNNGIPRMVRSYFYEMSCVISECARMLKAGARLLMVNDNVRYSGASVSVDLILSSIAEGLGLCVEQILVLPNGKGNSSQQMGDHGREPLRKCIYVWRKP